MERILNVNHCFGRKKPKAFSKEPLPFTVFTMKFWTHHITWCVPLTIVVEIAVLDTCLSIVCPSKDEWMRHFQLSSDQPWYLSLLFSCGGGLWESMSVKMPSKLLQNATCIYRCLYSLSVSLLQCIFGNSREATLSWIMPRKSTGQIRYKFCP